MVHDRIVHEKDEKMCEKMFRQRQLHPTDSLSEHQGLAFAVLNVEGAKHEGRVGRMLRAVAPTLDCVVFQEVREQFARGLTRLGFPYIDFVPMVHVMPSSSSVLVSYGLAVASRHPIESTPAVLLSPGDVDGVPTRGPREDIPQQRFLQVFSVSKDGVVYRIGNTHLASKYAAESPEARGAAMGALGHFVGDPHLEDLILVGDLGASRGDPLRELLPLEDRIPESVSGTLDPELHRVGEAVRGLVVDGVFASRGVFPALTVGVLKESVSDHRVLMVQTG